MHIIILWNKRCLFMWCPACCPSGPWLLEGRGRGRATEVTREPCCSIWILLWIFKKCLWCLNLLHVTAWKQHLNSISVCYFLHLSCLAQLLSRGYLEKLTQLASLSVDLLWLAQAKWLMCQEWLSPDSAQLYSLRLLGLCFSADIKEC